MGALADLSQEFIDYPHNYLTITIVDVIPSVGDTINEDEDIKFKVQLANNGPMHVDQLSLLVEGLNGTEVKSNGAAAEFDESFVYTNSDIERIPAHQNNNPVTTVGYFHFRPSREFASEHSLVRVSVEDWTTDWSHLQGGHTRKDELAQGTYRATVSPQ